MSAETLPFPAESPLDDLRRLYRRICVLRQGRRLTEALALEQGELPARLAAVRAAGAADQVADILAAEEVRVAEARLLAELIAPILADSLNLTLTSAPSASPTRAASARPALAREATAPAPSIADFIDGMLAQERPASAAARSSRIPASTDPRPQPATLRSS